MSRIFVWEKSQRAGMALVFQPALYTEMPHDGNGMKETDGRFILVHQEREDETEWGLIRFCETYPCPASRQIKIGKDKYASEPTQTRQDIDETQARERVARHLDRTVDSRGNRGSTATHNNQEDERPTQDQRGHDTERTGSNGSKAQSTEVHSTGEGSSQDGLASNNGDIQMTVDKVVEAVRTDLLQRSQIGIQKYGVTLERDDLKLRDWLQHAYEETLDQANYLKRAIMQIDGMTL